MEITPSTSHRQISIHTLRMEGDRVKAEYISREVSISIHTLRMEGDGYWRSSGDRLVSISIHTLRMEGDHKHQSGFLQEEYFNPHPPHGG